MRSLLILILAVLLASPLAACGRKGKPADPDDVVYPRDYPYTPLPVPIKKADPSQKQ